MSYTINLTIEGISENTPIVVESFTLGIQGSSASSGGAGSAPTDLIVNKTLDANSPRLFIAAATGKHFPKATLSFTKLGSTAPDTIFQLTEVVISSITYSGSGHGGTFPVEQIVIAYSRIEITQM